MRGDGKPPPAGARVPRAGRFHQITVGGRFLSSFWRKCPGGGCPARRRHVWETTSDSTSHRISTVRAKTCRPRAAPPRTAAGTKHLACGLTRSGPGPAQPAEAPPAPAVAAAAAAPHAQSTSATSCPLRFTEAPPAATRGCACAGPSVPRVHGSPGRTRSEGGRFPGSFRVLRKRATWLPALLSVVTSLPTGATGACGLQQRQTSASDNPPANSNRLRTKRYSGRLTAPGRSRRGESRKAALRARPASAPHTPAGSLAVSATRHTASPELPFHLQFFSLRYRTQNCAFNKIYRFLSDFLILPVDNFSSSLVSFF